MKKNLKGILGIFTIGTIGLMLAACGKKETSEQAANGVKTFKVAMEASYAPYNWTQSDDNNGAVKISGSKDYANGYDVMISKRIAEELGYNLEIVKLDWDSLVPAVQAGTVDANIAGQSITSKRKKTVDFTKPYYYASVVTLVKKDSAFANAKSIADLSGAKVTSQLNTFWYDLCAPQIPNANILPAQESAPAALVALNSGAADVVVTDLPTAQAALVAYPDFAMLDFTGTDGNYEVSDEEVEIGVAVKKGNTELVEAINSVLDKMTKEDFNKIMDEAIKVQPLSN